MRSSHSYDEVINGRYYLRYYGVSSDHPTPPHEWQWLEYGDGDDVVTLRGNGRTEYPDEILDVTLRDGARDRLVRFGSRVVQIVPAPGWRHFNSDAEACGFLDGRQQEMRGQPGFYERPERYRIEFVPRRVPVSWRHMPADQE